MDRIKTIVKENEFDVVCEEVGKSQVNALHQTALTKVKLEYGKDIDRYRQNFFAYKRDLELLKKAIEREDAMKASYYVENIESTIEYNNLIHLRLNEMICAILNTLPG